MNMMSDFDYALDIDEGYQDRFQEDEFQWNNMGPGPCPGPGPGPGPMFNSRRSNGGFMNARYSEAFGDYRGGYGRGGGFGAPRPRPYPPVAIRGRGFGPFGPPQQQRRGTGGVHRAAQFLAKCEVAPQHIKGLPWRLLDMIAPDYCGLCAQHFDSFALAKIHYSCKNHYKAQKKFMSLHKSNKNQNEVPMKARNLYCELCDVHITSTSHADSHYSGKSHRAIVEKRKPPKNPILLQQGMENRVDQLIRREKRSFKAAPESVKQSVEEKAEQLKAADKNVPPELVCEICKTSVTCSEQMTNHLNGKKHLTKEKQHILNMMKGKANKKKTNENKIEEENTEEENTEEVKEAEEQEMEEETAVEAEAVNDDWTTGDGAGWDGHNTAQPSTDIEGSSASVETPNQ